MLTVLYKLIREKSKYNILAETVDATYICWSLGINKQTKNKQKRGNRKSQDAEIREGNDYTYWVNRIRVSNINKHK